MRCVLPGGLVDEAGTVHGEVELRGLSGREEEILAGGRRGETASLVTSILSACVERIGAIEEIDAGVVRRLLVADRQFILLRLREATFGDRVQGSVPCPWPDCGRRVTVSFSTRDVPVTPSADKGPLYVLTLSEGAMPGISEQERRVEFRLPNGGTRSCSRRCSRRTRPPLSPRCSRAACRARERSCRHWRGRRSSAGCRRSRRGSTSRWTRSALSAGASSVRRSTRSRSSSAS